MKVWIVSVGEPLPIDGENVRLRRMGNLAMYLSKQGIDVEWFSVSFDHYKKKQRCLKDSTYQINSNLKLRISFTNGYKKNISLSRIWHHRSAGEGILRLMEQSRQPDIIFASMEPLEVSESAVKYANKYRLPCIIDIRDLWPEIYYDVIPSYLHWALDYYVKQCCKKLSFTMKSCNSIVGLSNGFLEYGLKYASRPRSSLDRVIPIAYPNYDYSSYYDRFEEFWGGYGLKRDDFIITFLGNFGDQFHFQDIIEVSQKFINKPNVKFVLCGNGKNQENVRLATGDNVVIPGWIEKDQILSLLSCSKLGVAPYINSMNYRLNTTNKFAEYLSASLPIAVSVHGEMEDLLVKHSCGYYYDGSEGLLKIIDRYRSSTDLQKRHSINARRLYEDLFNADNINEKMLDHIITVLKEGI